MMEAAEQVLYSALGVKNGSGFASIITTKDPQAAQAYIAAKAQSLVPEVTVRVLATPANIVVSSAGAQSPAAAPVSSPPFEAYFDLSEKTCVVAKDDLGGSMAKYLVPLAQAVPARGLRAICGGGAQFSYLTKLGNFDTSACGSQTLSKEANEVEGKATTVNVNVVGCEKMSRPSIEITKLQVCGGLGPAGRLQKQSWVRVLHMMTLYMHMMCFVVSMSRTRWGPAG